MHAYVNIQFETGNRNASLNYHLCLYTVCWWLNWLTDWKKETKEKKKQQNKRAKQSSNWKKGNKMWLVCTFYWVCEYVCCVFVLCMFLLHLFGTVASVQLKTLFRSHRLLCNGIVHNAHTTFSLYYIRLLYSCVCDWCFFFLTSVFTICWVFFFFLISN